MSIWKTVSNSNFIKFLKWAVTKPAPKKEEKKKVSKDEKWRKNTVWEKPKRARTVKGRYKGDDKSTPDVNEAWMGGKAPKKK
jgi:hypothetical protein|tara:strand:+ start:426 stop:671 length:246 start_codon:yes stop_codon:yes gene_type:complete